MKQNLIKAVSMAFALCSILVLAASESLDVAAKKILVKVTTDNYLKIAK